MKHNVKKVSLLVSILMIVCCIGVVVIQVLFDTNESSPKPGTNNPPPDPGPPEVVEHVCSDYEYVSAKKHTCTEDGILAHYKCKECGKLYKKVDSEYILIEESDTVDKARHDYIGLWDDVNHHLHCRRCGEDKALVPATHEYDPTTHMCACGKYDDTYYTGDMTFEKRGETYALTSYSGEDEVIVVPRIYNSLKVTTIAKGALTNYNAKRIILPSSIKNLEVGAINYKAPLEAINLPLNCDLRMSEIYGNFGGKIYLEMSRKDYYTNDIDNYSDVLVWNYNMVEGEKFDYIVSDGVHIVKYKGNDTKLTIPDTIDGQEVVEIMSEAFYNNTTLQEVVLPDSLEYIEKRAFMGCTNLTRVNIPRDLRFSSRYAFKDCTSLSRVDIADINSFMNSNYYEQYSNPITYAHNIYMNDTLVNKVIIPDEVTEIHDYLFSGATCINEIENEEHITSIFNGGLMNGPKVTKLNFDYLETVNGEVFVGCDMDIIINGEKGPYWSSDALEGFLGGVYFNTKDIVKVNGVTYAIHKDDTVSAEHIDSSTIDAVILNEVDYLGKRVPVTKLGDIVTAGNVALESLVIPDKFKSLPRGLLDGAINLTSLTIANNGFGSSEDISYLFGSNTPIALTDITIGNAYLSGGMFSDATNLRQINITKSIEDIDQFIDNKPIINVANLKIWTDTKGITANNNPLSNGSKLYVGGVDVVDLVITADIVSVPDYAFYNYAPLETLTIEEGVTVGVNAFKGCTLKKASMPAEIVGCVSNEDLPEIEITSGKMLDAKFQYNEALTTLTLPNTLRSIATSFEKNTLLNRVNIADIGSYFKIHFKYRESSPLYHGGSLYIDGQMVRSIIVPEEIDNIKSYALYGGRNIDELRLPANLKHVNKEALANCSPLSILVAPTEALDTLTNASGVNRLTINGGDVLYKDINTGTFSSLNYCHISATVGKITDRVLNHPYVDFYMGAKSEPAGYNRGEYNGVSNDYIISCRTISWGHNNVTTNPDYDYEVLNDDTIVITNVKHPTSSMTIPDMIDGKKVVSIGTSLSADNTVRYLTLPKHLRTITAGAFAKNKSIGEVNIPNDGECYKIGAEAFSESTLWDINFPSSLESIEYNAFLQCYAMRGKSILIPANVQYLGNQIYYGVGSDPKYENIVMPLILFESVDANMGFYDTGWERHGYDMNDVLEYRTGRNGNSFDVYSYSVHDNKVYLTNYRGTETDVVVPDTIKDMPVVAIGSAFFSNRTMTSITLPDSVKLVPWNAFKYNKNLADIYVGENTIIEDGVFHEYAHTIVHYR